MEPTNIDTGSYEPGYQQLARLLAQRIVSGELAAGAKLAQERELAGQFEVSRFTVRNALNVLEAQGLIQRVRGKGTFVAGGPAGKRWFSTASTVLFVYVGATRASPYPTDGYYGDIYAGVKRAARTMGLQLRVEGIRSYVHVALDEYRPPKPAEVGGVIVCGTFDEQYIRMFGSEGVPVVVVDFWTHDANADSVIVDVESDAYTAVEHLAGKGHTSVGFFALGRQERGSEAFEYDPDIWRMLDGLRRAAQRRRMELRDEWIVLVPNQRPRPVQVARQLLSLRERPTALICFDITAATPALEAIDEAGLRCPEDISVLARGGETTGQRRLTSLIGDPELMGEVAAGLLLERMRGRRQRALRVAVVTRLVLGETTGPAPRTFA